MPYKDIEYAKQKRHQLYIKNRDSILAQNKTPAFRKRRARNQRKYYSKNREKLKAESKSRSHLHYLKNKDLYKKRKSIRDRKLGFIKLVENDWEEPVDWHHVDNTHVVPIPRYLHRMCYTGDREKHRQLCNKLVKLLYGDIKWKKQ